jgi:hypothetical protein
MIDTARNIIQGEVLFPKSLSEIAKEFISACLRKHAGDRPTVKDMMRMPWLLQHQVSLAVPGTVHQPRWITILVKLRGKRGCYARLTPPLCTTDLSIAHQLATLRA